MAERFLVVANQSLGGAALIRSIAAKAQRRAEIHIVVPATDPQDDPQSAPGATAQANAERRLATELERCQAAGINATGEVGLADPLQVIRHAVQANRYTGLIISTLPAGVSRWVHMDLPHRAVREFGLPVEWVEARSDTEEPTSVHIEVPAAAKRALDRPNIPPQHTPPHR
jgi:GABA permease